MSRQERVSYPDEVGGRQGSLENSLITLRPHPEDGSVLILRFLEWKGERGELNLSASAMLKLLTSALAGQAHLIPLGAASLALSPPTIGNGIHLTLLMSGKGAISGVMDFTGVINFMDLTLRHLPEHNFA